MNSDVPGAIGIDIHDHGAAAVRLGAQGVERNATGTGQAALAAVLAEIGRASCRERV